MTLVTPTQTRAPRIGAIAALPAFFNLKGKRVVVAGNGAAAAWKAELAAAAGARVDVFAPRAEDDVRALSELAQVSVIERGWEPDDLTGAALAIGALDGDEAKAFAEASKQAGVPVNIVDTPHLSTFSFGTVVSRGAVTIGIGTDGVAPVLGQEIRSRIEVLLHPVIGVWAGAARQVRDAVKARFDMGPDRRAAWSRFARAALAARTPPQNGDIERLVLGEHAKGGSVALVGAGPGDPELLTLKALRAIGSADVILYDRLVTPEILALARREASRICVGKTGGGRSCRQADINALMVHLALEGKRVVRLKGGDPMIFGRAGEEIAACRDAGVSVESIPGVTAALGAASELLLPLTDRKFAKRLEFVTGHAEDGRAPDHDWTALADPWTTTVFYMGARTFGDMLPKLLDAGLDPLTPALIVSAATTSQSSVVRASASELGKCLAALRDDAPRLLIVGRVAGQITDRQIAAVVQAALEPAG